MINLRPYQEKETGMLTQSVKCDMCGKIITGAVHPVYNENYKIQKGLKQCGKCLISKK